MAGAARPHMWGSRPLFKDWTLAGPSCMGRMPLVRAIAFGTAPAPACRVRSLYTGSSIGSGQTRNLDGEFTRFARASAAEPSVEHWRERLRTPSQTVPGVLVLRTIQQT